MKSITSTIEPEGVRLSLDPPVELPLGSAVRDLAHSEPDAIALLSLDDLWQEGLLERLKTGEWVVPFDRLLHVEPPTAHALELPEPDSNVRAELRSVGTLTSDTFEITLDLRHPRFGGLLPADRSGPAFVLDDGTCVLLGQDMWQLLCCVNARPERTAGSVERYEYAGRCVESAQKAGAQIDAYLMDNQVEILDKLCLDVTEEGPEIVLGVSSGDFRNEDLVLRNGKAKLFPILVSKGGARHRVVASKEAHRQAEEITKGRRLHGARVPEFLQNPEAFGPEGLDLSDFSERVRGFRTKVYNSRPYLHVQRQPRGWLKFEAGAVLDTTFGSSSETPPPAIGSGEYRRLAAKAAECGERFVRHGNDWIEIDPRQAKQFLEAEGRVIEHAEGNRIRKRVLLDVIPNVELLEFEVRLPEGLKAQRPWMEELPEIAPPASFDAHLDPHQILGFRWLCYLNERGGGGLLADEMGVGKTAQVIALFAHLHERSELAPTLVILPKTLVPNWRRELRNLAPGIKDVWEHVGATRSRSEEFLKSREIVITTYDTARSDQVLLAKIDWKLVVADEAQFVKNPTAARTAVVKALKSNQALALTGTPVENGLIEFWCIMDYVQPGLLKSWSEFRKEFERPLVETHDEAKRQELVEELLSELDPHYLRRLKSEVLAELPEKRAQIDAEITLGTLQRQRYEEILATAHEGGRGAVLGAITRLLRTCSHPRAADEDWEGLDGDSLIAECPKLAKTMEILEEVRSFGEKAVVFTTWKSTQHILQRAILARLGVAPAIVNGDLTTNRQAVIDQFREQAGFGVVILAPEVAGYGLNLTEANHVIHYTRPWNPAKENQATDRVHRRGQKKRVTVYYPTVRGTVEEKLAQLLADKEQLARDVLRPTAERNVTAEDLVQAIEGPEA